MRQLVTKRIIKNVQPIPKADRIEVVTIDGWKCVAKKGEFQIGDECIYIEIDSFLPEERPDFQFLAKTGVFEMEGRKGYVLRTGRFQGQVSQGLALPLSQFPDLDYSRDLAEQLNVRLYEEPIPDEIKAIAVSMYPTFIKTTDLDRIQNLPNLIAECDHTFEVTQKMDGQSCTIFWKDGDFGVAQKSVRLKENPDNKFWQMAIKYGLKEKMDSWKTNIAIQGELIGPGVVKNPHKLTELGLRVFGVFDIDMYEHFKPQNAKALVEGFFGLEYVPVIWVQATFESLKITNMDELMAYVDSTCQAMTPHAEGLVFKSQEDSRVRFKVISNKHLLSIK